MESHIVNSCFVINLIGYKPVEERHLVARQGQAWWRLVKRFSYLGVTNEGQVRAFQVEGHNGPLHSFIFKVIVTINGCYGNPVAMVQ